jgi:hypothetical protein
MLGVTPIEDGTKKYRFTSRQDVEDLKIQAYFKVDGDTQWQVEDWSDKQYMSFCRDASEERLTDLVVVISNSSPDKPITNHGEYYAHIQVSDIGCWRYSGNASLEVTGEGSNGVFSDIQNITDVVFERTDTHPNIPYPFLRFQVVGGQLARKYEYTGEDCQGDGEQTSQLGARNKYELYILYGAIEGASKNRYGGTSNADQSISVAFDCGVPPGSIPSFPWFFTDALSTILDKVYKLSDNSIMDGMDNMVEGINNAQMKYTWHLEPFIDKGGPGDTSSDSLFNSGSSSITNPSGQFSTPVGGAYPTLQPTGIPTLPDIPIYPNIETSQQNQYGMIILTTADPMIQVAQFYQTEMVKLGWNDGSLPYDSTSETIQLNFMKEKSMLIIGISNLEGMTTIMITQVGG